MRQLLLTFVLSSVATAQFTPWTGILDTSRATDWTHAGVWNSPPLTGHGIPHRTTLCTLTGFNATNNVIMPSGNTDMTDANNINAAMQQCAAQASAASPLVLQLGAGTFYIPGAVTFGSVSNNWPSPGPFNVLAHYVTLRGQGPDQTTLVATTTGIQCGAQGNAICMVGSGQDSPTSTIYSYSGACSWTAGYAQGTTILTLGSCMIGQNNPNQNGIANQVNGMPQVGMHIILDQRNDDVGLLWCSSSGTLATCTAAGPLPAAFQVGACVGVGGTGNNGNTNVAPGTTGQGGTWLASGYNTSLMVPLRYTGSTTPQTCTAAITAIGSNTTANPCTVSVPCPTFSYTLPAGGANAATWFCGPNPTASAAPLYGTNTLPSGVTSQNVASCFATVDTVGNYVTGVTCVTGSGNCTSNTFGAPSSVGGGITNGRVCPDTFYNGSSGPHPQVPTCAANEVSWRSHTVGATVVGVQGNGCPSCTANQIMIDTPLADINWRTGRAPGVFWFRSILHDAGVEDLTINCLNDGGTSSNGSIAMWHCYNCWLRNVRSISGSRNHVWMYVDNSHNEVRDSYFWGNKRGATQSYGVELFNMSSNVLVENNILEHIVSALMNGGASGSVESYNYMVDDGYGSTTPLINMAMESANHDPNGFNLFEGNNANTALYDNVHGANAGPITHFRERLRGQNIPVKNNYLGSFVVAAFNRGANAIGEVMGVPSTWPPISPNATTMTLYSNTYQISYKGSGACNLHVFCGGSDAQGSPIMNDDHVSFDSLLRWGNYDTVTASTPSGTSGSDGTGIRWCGTGSEANCSLGCTANAAPGWKASCSEIPGAFYLLPANAVPSSHTLPPSFYLQSQPAWFVTPWGTPPWPPIGPDVTGGTNPDDSSGHSYAIPSQLAYTNASVDTSFVDSRTVVQTANWTTSGTVTVTGTLYLDNYGTFRMQGSQPPNFNGVFKVLSTNGPSAPYPNVTVCGSSSLPCSATELPGGTQNGMLGTLPSTGNITYTYGLTGLTAAGGETQLGSTIKTNPGISSGCPGASGGTLNCTARVASPTSSGSGTAQTTQYDVYMGIQSGVTAGMMCKQNASPIAIGTPYYQQTAVILAAQSDGVTPNPACVAPPRVPNVPATTITYLQPINPCGTGSSCAMTTAGTITYPYIRVFNANNSYGTGTLPPQLPAASMSVTPTSITVGQSATLSWTTSNATSVTITPIGTVAASGSQSVSPTVTTTYTLTATNANGSAGATAVLTVTAAPVAGPNGINGNGKITGQGKIIP